MVAKFLELNKPKTSLKKSIRTASNFIDLIQFHLIWQMLAKFSRVAYVAGAKSPIPFDACYTGYSRVESERSVRIKRKTTNFVLCCEIRKFNVPGVQRRQRSAQNRVLQVQICCLVLIKTFYFFCRSPSVAVGRWFCCHPEIVLPWWRDVILLLSEGVCQIFACKKASRPGDVLWPLIKKDDS